MLARWKVSGNRGRSYGQPVPDRRVSSIVLVRGAWSLLLAGRLTLQMTRYGMEDSVSGSGEGIREFAFDVSRERGQKWTNVAGQVCRCGKVYVLFE